MTDEAWNSLQESWHRKNMNKLYLKLVMRYRGWVKNLAVLVMSYLKKMNILSSLWMILLLGGN